MRQFHHHLCLTVAWLLLVTGCVTHTARDPVESGFLTRYDQLTKVDDTTSRYIDAARLRTFTKFKIHPVQVRVKSIDGKPIASEEQMAGEYVAMALISALSDRYPIVSSSGPRVGNLHLAITGADKKGTQLAMRLEGEVLDSVSNTQVAALMKSEISAQQELNWSYRLTFRQMVKAWAADLRRVLDEVQTQRIDK